MSFSFLPQPTPSERNAQLRKILHQLTNYVLALSCEMELRGSVGQSEKTLLTEIRSSLKQMVVLLDDSGQAESSLTE